MVWWNLFIRGDRHLKGPFALKRPVLSLNLNAIRVFRKRIMRAFISCMVACSLPTNDWVPSQNVEGSWWSQAQLKQKQEGKQQYCSDEKTRDACTFLHAIWSYVRVDQATIPHLKEDNQNYLLIIDQDCSLTDRYFLNVFLSRAWVYHVCSWFCAANQLFPIADLTITPHMKAHILLFK